MHSTVKNEFGTITIDNEVIGRLAGLTAMECYGVVGMAAKSIRDGLVHLLKIESLTKGVRTKVTEDNELIINLHIIVEYGTNIHAIANTLIDNVKYKLETFVGLTVREVNVFVESVRV
ncbi:MAG: Asp23/Gls24 family envelope stress response protein [Defluviitaleaceae bacterium]|nr:Asp23/Gls24 family envelope stress response protein [Defluviitaleaceae bacterium]MCL2239442.1 Asp23/Gls24 family envelope stress response protein [Defluviitaleaceae bacterium]